MYSNTSIIPHHKGVIKYGKYVYYIETTQAWLWKYIEWINSIEIQMYSDLRKLLDLFRLNNSII